MPCHRFSFHRATQILAAALSALACSTALAGDAWPTRPIRLVVGYPPGGSIDILARSVAEAIAPSLGQSVIVENKPGASSNLAAGGVVRSQPDGYTLLVSSSSVETANPMLYKSNFKVSRDLIPVDSIGRGAIYVVARPGLEANNIRELITLAKARPDALSFGTPGTGTQPHLAGELFKLNAGIKAMHIPYKGSAPALQDVMAGQIDFMMDPGIALPYIKAGKVKLLGIFGSRRSPFFPEVPTLAEQGVAGADLDLWYGIWAPKDTPKAIVARISQELRKAARQTALKEQFANVSTEPEVIGDTEFRKVLSRESEVFSRLIESLGITPN